MSERTAQEIDLDARVTAILDRWRRPVLDAMRGAIDRPGIAHARLMRYHLGWEDAQGAAIESAAGKMLRPALCMLACEAIGGAPTRALPAAAAIELLHNFTLIHDDIEDQSDTRHGRTTLWRVAGIPQAINAGDGMFVLAQRTLLEIERHGVSAAATLEASRRLNDACVALCEGQYADLTFESRSDVTVAEYETMIRGKTASLVAASAAIGALAGVDDPAVADAFGRYGFALGFAFQIEDDLLGLWGDPKHTGKSVWTDLLSRKKSFPVVYAFDALADNERRELGHIYTIRDSDEATLRRALSLIESSGGRQASAATAARWSSEAVELIAALPMSGAQRDDFEALARFAAHRRA